MDSRLDYQIDQKLINELTKFCYSGNFESVQRILDHCPANIDCCDSEGRTPLYAASCSDSIELCIYLLNVSYYISLEN